MRLPVALVQLDATTDITANIAAAVALADEAAAGGARLVALPEYLQYRGPDDGFRASARPIPGPHTEPFGEVARRRGAWILVGSTAELSADPARPFNTSTLIAPDGSIAAIYRKLHLFDVDIEDGPSDSESARATAGDRHVTADVDGVMLGLTICYDLRFPELYRALALAGAQVMTVPANFTERTGRDHWDVLLRARAIENGAYVLAPAQIGGPAGQPAYGHSMIVDPWGTVLAQAPDAVGIIRVDIETDRVAAVRRQIPVLANRRPEAYRPARRAETDLPGDDLWGIAQSPGLRQIPKSGGRGPMPAGLEQRSTMSAWEALTFNSTQEAPNVGGGSEEVELVGPHLRVQGTVALGMFHRLSDRVNHSRGYIHVRDARLMRRNGDPTDLTLEELMINQDEITFIGQRLAGSKGAGVGVEAYGDALARETRRYVFFTEGHTISGDVHVYGESDLAAFVEASEPRFVPLVGARARSLADRRVISHYELLLLNRTQTTAVAEASRAASFAD